MISEDKKFLKTIWDTVLTGVFIVDASNRQIVDLNAEAERLIGLPREKVIGKVCHQFVCPAETQSCPVLDLNHEVNHSEKVLLNCNGKKIPIYKTVSKTKIDDREYLVESFVDISEQKQVELLMIAAKEQAEKASRLKSEFLATMSHEIRTPLSGIIGAVELLQGTKLSGEQTEYAQSIVKSGKLLSSIIGDILDFSKIEIGDLSLDISEIQFQGFLKDLIGFYAKKAELKGLEFRYDINREIPDVILGDSVKLRQVLSNLLDNAIKFTDNGFISLTVSLKSSENNNEILFEISDSGCGIAPDRFEQVFDSFVQEDSSIVQKYGGTGLGLAICRNLAEFMGGTVDVVSSKSQGSTFSFNFPLKISDSAKKNDKDSGEVLDEKDKFSGMKVLMVEDNQINQMIAQRVLVKAGCEVIVANNGAEAVDLFENNSFDLIFMDIQMPVMDGYEASIKIRELEKKKSNGNECSIPIIALSACALKENHARSLEAGMNEYLVKPFRKRNIFQILSKYF